MYNLYTPVCVLTYLYTRVYVPVLVLKPIQKYSDIYSFVILVFFDYSFNDCTCTETKQQ